MPKLGITSGGRHEWIVGQYGLMRKPVNGHKISLPPIKVKNYNPNAEVELRGSLMGFPVFGPKRSWWRKLLSWFGF